MNIQKKAFSLGKSTNNWTDLVVIIVVHCLGIGTLLGSLIYFSVDINSLPKIV